MKNALNIFKTKIKFTYEPIPEIFNEISQITNKNIGNIFKFAKEQMGIINAGDAWEKAIIKTQNNLNSQDKETLVMLSKLLGEADLEGQVSQIDITLNFLEKQIEDAEQEKNKNEKLFKKLGTIVGMAIAIILV